MDGHEESDGQRSADRVVATRHTISWLFQPGELPPCDVEVLLHSPRCALSTIPEDTDDDGRTDRNADAGDDCASPTALLCSQLPPHNSHYVSALDVAEAEVSLPDLKTPLPSLTAVSTGSPTAYWLQACSATHSEAKTGPANVSISKERTVTAQPQCSTSLLIDWLQPAPQQVHTADTMPTALPQPCEGFWPATSLPSGDGTMTSPTCALEQHRSNEAAEQLEGPAVAATTGTPGWSAYPQFEVQWGNTVLLVDTLATLYSSAPSPAETVTTVSAHMCCDHMPSGNLASLFGSRNSFRDQQVDANRRGHAGVEVKESNAQAGVWDVHVRAGTVSVGLGGPPLRPTSASDGAWSDATSAFATSATYPMLSVPDRCALQSSSAAKQSTAGSTQSRAKPSCDTVGQSHLLPREAVIGVRNMTLQRPAQPQRSKQALSPGQPRAAIWAYLEGAQSAAKTGECAVEQCTQAGASAAAITHPHTTGQRSDKPGLRMARRLLTGRGSPLKATHDTH